MRLRFLLGLAGFLFAPLVNLFAQDDASPSPDRAALIQAASAEIRTAIDAYVSAFNDGDVEKLGSMWTRNGVYSATSTGERVIGRDAIVKQFKQVIAAQDAAPKLVVETDSIEFVSPSVGIERGNALVTRGDAASESQYTAVYVKKDDKWLVDRITEEEVVSSPSHYENLRPLEWLIGEWVDDGEGFSIETTAKWTENQNYISRTYKVATPSGFESSGLQVIGWDASEKQIRSWLFDSNGSFVSGTWNARDGQWTVQSVATLADGSKGSFTSIFKPTEDGNYTWQKVHRVLAGELLPNIDEVVIRRK